MPEIVIPDKYADQVPRFILPKEFSNEAEVKPEVKKEAPAEPPKEEAKPAAEAPATEPEKEPESETTEKDPEKSATRRFERRIDRAHRRAAEAQARAETLERELTELRAKSAPVVPSNAPKMEDFTDVQEYAKAYGNFEKANAIKDYEQKQQNAVVHAQRVKLEQDWGVKVAKALDKYDDWDEVVGELKPTSPWSLAIHKADNGTDIAHYLGSHQAEARKIFALDPYDQIREIGKLEMKLVAPVTAKLPSKAPAPIEPVTTGGSLSGTEVEPNQPYEAYRPVGNKMFRRS